MLTANQLRESAARSGARDIATIIGEYVGLGTCGKMVDERGRESV
jgi:hypothetical protein